MRLPARARTTLQTGPDAAAARTPERARASTHFPTNAIATDSFLSILVVHARAVAEPSHVRPVHLQRLKLPVMRTVILVAISNRREAHRLDDEVEEHGDERADADLPTAPQRARTPTPSAPFPLGPFGRRAFHSVAPFPLEAEREQDGTEDEHDIIQNTMATRKAHNGWSSSLSRNWRRGQ